jgi:hypothetical protein
MRHVTPSIWPMAEMRPDHMLPSMTPRRPTRRAPPLPRHIRTIIAGLPPDGPVASTAHELLRLLYGVEAVLRLHFAQKDEISHALADG